MLNDFLVSIGLRRPHIEVWHCEQLVIINVDTQIIWCRPGVIEYCPMPEHYWGGQAEVFDIGADEPRFRFTLDRVEAKDENSVLIPYLALMGHPGGKIFGRDADGELVTIYVGQHAVNFIAARAQVDASEDIAINEEDRE